MKKTIVSLVVFLMLVMPLTAGGSKDSGATTTAGNSQAVAVKPANWKESDATKSFSYHVGSAIVSLDKWVATSNNTIQAIEYCIFDPILSRDEDGNLIPWLAKDWKFTDDFMAVTFYLRDDVYFTNGTKFTADDLIFTFERLRDDTTHYAAASVRNWRPYLGTLTKNGDYEVTLNLNMKMPEFSYLIIDPAIGVICKSAYESMDYDTFWRKPIGTGAYVVESWDSANNICKMTLRSDPNGYWGYKAYGTYTNVKNLTVQYSPEGQTRISSLRSGEVQMIEDIPTTSKATLERDGFITQAMRPVNLTFLQTASARGDAFDNQKLREALSLCIDRELIVESLLSGFAIPCTEPCRPGDLGYTGVQNIFYNPERAKQLVAESGYDGRPLNFIFTTSVVNIGNELSQAIQSMAASVGINLRINMLEVAVYDQDRLAHQFDLVLSNIADSGNYWFKIGNNVIGQDRFNTGFQNARLKQLGLDLGDALDPNEADKIYKEMYSIETKEFAPNIYLYFPTRVHSWVRNATGMRFHGAQIPNLHAVVLN